MLCERYHREPSGGGGGGARKSVRVVARVRCVRGVVYDAAETYGLGWQLQAQLLAEGGVQPQYLEFRWRLRVFETSLEASDG